MSITGVFRTNNHQTTRNQAKRGDREERRGDERRGDERPGLYGRRDGVARAQTRAIIPVVIVLDAQMLGILWSLVPLREETDI